jgi:hypothetical protein
MCIEVNTRHVKSRGNIRYKILVRTLANGYPCYMSPFRDTVWEGKELTATIPYLVDRTFADQCGIHVFTNKKQAIKAWREAKRRHFTYFERLVVVAVECTHYLRGGTAHGISTPLSAWHVRNELWMHAKIVEVIKE